VGVELVNDLLRMGENKAERNLRIHGVDFDEASVVFEDPYRTTEEDSVVENE